jgi:hypothetical protein
VTEYICFFRPATEISLKMGGHCKNIADFSSPLDCQTQDTGGCFFKYKNTFHTNLFPGLLRKEIPAKRGMHH